LLLSHTAALTLLSTPPTARTPPPHLQAFEALQPDAFDIVVMRAVVVMLLAGLAISTTNAAPGNEFANLVPGQGYKHQVKRNGGYTATEGAAGQTLLHAAVTPLLDPQVITQMMKHVARVARIAMEGESVTGIIDTGAGTARSAAWRHVALNFLFTLPCLAIPLVLGAGPAPFAAYRVPFSSEYVALFPRDSHSTITAADAWLPLATWLFSMFPLFQCV